MQRGVLYVETQPASEAQADEYHRWYNEDHLPDILAIDGIVAARRLRPVDGEGPFVAFYEIEAEDLQVVMGEMQAATERGEVRMSDTLRLDPPPTVRLLEVIEAQEQG